MVKLFEKPTTLEKILHNSDDFRFHNAPVMSEEQKWQTIKARTLVWVHAKKGFLDFLLRKDVAQIGIVLLRYNWLKQITELLREWEGLGLEKRGES